MSPTLKIHRHPSEHLYGFLLTVFGGLFWFLFMLFVVVGALESPRGIAHLFMICVYGLFIYLTSIMTAALYRAYAMGNMVALSEDQFPELHTQFVAIARELGLAETPQAFIHNSGGVMNAFAIRLLRGRYVFLTSAIVEAEDNAQLRFIMAHEIAHHALGHLNAFKHFIRLPALFIPFLYRAYSRAREFSCDAVGASVLPDVHDALTALQMLACGTKRLNKAMNVDAFAAQDFRVPGLAGFLVEIASTHPRLTRRVAYLKANFKRHAA